MSASNYHINHKSHRKVLILKNEDFITISIPAVGLFSQSVLKQIILLILPTYLVSFIFIILSYQNPNLIIPVICLLSVISFAVLMTILVSEFAEKRLFINQRQISLSYKLFGKNLWTARNLRTNITNLEIDRNILNKRYLIIWAARQKYEFFTAESDIFAVTNPELNWLARELSEWLNLPITKE